MGQSPGETWQSFSVSSPGGVVQAGLDSPSNDV